ncbi:MAG: glucose 1-dehydrogenase [Ardenticatenaceae bacterium]|nr:glucose 1-dehydrogenase [Ardenticatenaceae bacterium]
MELENRVAIITGSGQGIGKATATALAKAGACIVLNDIVAERVQKTAREIEALGTKVLAVPGDVTRTDDIANIVNQTLETFGKIDILVNNVGITRGVPGVEIDEKDWRAVLELDVTAHYLCAKAVVPLMKAQRSGKIVNMASQIGKYRSSIVYGGTLALATAKAAVLGFTRQLAYELGQYRINVNAVAPGNILTEEGEKDWNGLPEEMRTRVLRETAMGRLGRPEEIASVIKFLVSDRARYITGQTLLVNGGWWMS